MSCRTLPTLASAPLPAPVCDQGDLKVVAFLCNWCSYAGADKAGAHQLAIPHELTVIRVMCSGRVEPTLVLEAFEKGADGVMVLACHPGDCHYKEGNLRAFCRASLLEGLIPQLGVRPERFRFDYVSAAESEKFAQITTEFVTTLHSLPKPTLLREATHGD